MKFAIGIGVALAICLTMGGCTPRDKQLPVLTRDAFFAAARKCGAQEVEFRFSTDGSLPSFSYLDPGPFDTGKATPTSQCLADSLKGYRYQSMTIRTKPGAPAGE
jgi:hypothetical protein